MHAWLCTYLPHQLFPPHPFLLCCPSVPLRLNPSLLTRHRLPHSFQLYNILINQASACLSSCLYLRFHFRMFDIAFLVAASVRPHSHLNPQPSPYVLNKEPLSYFSTLQELWQTQASDPCMTKCSHSTHFPYMFTFPLGHRTLSPLFELTAESP